MLQHFFRRLVARQVSSSDIDDQLHIIISGERGDVTRIPCSRKKLHRLSITIFLLLLSVPLLFGLMLFTYTDIEVVPFFGGRGAGVTAAAASVVERNSAWGEFEQARSLVLQPDLLELKLEKKDDSEVNVPLTKEGHLYKNIEELKAQIAVLKEEKQDQLRRFDSEREEAFGSTIEELSERKEKLDKLFQAVGIIVPRHNKLKIKGNSGAGGPFHELSPLERRQEELVSWVDTYIDRLGKVPVGRPSTGELSSPFGKRRDPFNGRIAYHDGLDFRGKTGAPIYATADGIVDKALFSPSYGNMVKIHHNKTYSTLFGHMSKILVKKGDRVKRGDVIGAIGNTGRSTGAHLHYEVHKRGIAIDPEKFVTAADIVKKTKRR